MAIFGRKPSAPPSGDAGAGQFEFSPEKAKRFFSHARTVHDATNYEYAMTSWLNGLRQDPSSTEGLEGFFQSAAAYLGGTTKKSPSREMVRTFSGKTPLEKYLQTLLQWGCDPTDASLAVAATTAAAGLGLPAPTIWLGRRALAVAAGDKKPRKANFLTLMETFEKFAEYDLAVKAGQGALNLDPADSKLEATLRNMAAQATMSKGGFDQVGQAGGFRANIRDAEKQRRLEEEERVVKTAETLDRLIEAAKADYEARPGDKPTIRKYAKLLLERGTPEDEESAHALLMRAYQETQEFAFRQAAGEIRLRQARRRVNKLAAAASAEGATEEARAAHEKAKQELLDLEVAELRLRVENYPTDLGLKFELGKRDFELGNYDSAISLFQEAKAEIKNRIKVMNYLGQAFYKIDFHDGAIETYREALESVPANDVEMVMELKYGLMLALESRAKENKALADAEEAYRLASQIAIQQFNYRDVRTKREEIKALVASLKGGE